MGWTFTHKEPTETTLDFFKREFSGTEILDCATYGWSEAYLACKSRERVFAIVCKLQRKPQEEYNFGYKDINEEMGPYYFNCPERILRLLSPTKNEYAKNWRLKCLERIEKRKAKPKLNDGDIVRFYKPIEFRGGEKRDAFRVRIFGRKIRFVHPEASRDYPTPNYYSTIYNIDYRNRDFEIIEGGT